MIKAGILFPRSGIYPLLGGDFINGIQSYLKNEGSAQEAELILEPIGFGGDKKEAYQKAEKLFLVDNADILFAFLDLRVADLLYPLADALQKPLIIINPGANYSENWVAPENVIFLDLKDALHCRLAGKAAIKRSAKPSILSVSYYDGGYHHVHALVTPFLEGNGSIAMNYISPLKEAEFNINAIAQCLENDPAVEQLLTIFSGNESIRFLKAISETVLDRKLFLFASPFMVEKQVIDKIDFSFRHELLAYVPWHIAVDNDANTVFKEVISKETKREANVFHLLGWEAGLLLNVYLKQEEKNSKALVAQLGKTDLPSPRGTLQFEPESHHFIGPIYSVLFNEHGLSIEEAMLTSAAMGEWKELMSQTVQGDTSGWTNTYLCS